MPGPQDQGDQIELPRAHSPDGARSADSYGPGDRPERGSIADLRERLRRLPHGHPSSPYHDDGTPKPPDARLENLELPLPGEARESNGAVRRDTSASRVVTLQAGDSAAPAEADAGPVTLPGSDVQDSQPAAPAPDPAQPDREPEGSKPADQEPADQEPAGRKPEPADTEPAATEPADTEPADTEPAKREAEPADQDSALDPIWNPRPVRETTPGPPDPVQDQPATPEHEPAARDEEPAPVADAGPGDDEPTTQDQPAIVDDQAPSPAEIPAAGRAESLTPEQVRLAVRTLGQCRLAEGRNMFGSYGDDGLTPAMRRIEDQLEHGELVPDTEKYALKSLDRFQEKLSKLILRNPDKSADELAHEIHDGVRYTFIFDEDSYHDGVWEVHRELKEQGSDLEFRRNTWTKPDYKGINSRWHDPVHDVLFEVQFHTMASWDAKQRTHDYYEKISDLTAPLAERNRLRAAQREISATVPLPPRCTEVPDYRQEGK
jgi:hypothetical protein